jgi:hypothetical protein
MTGHQYVFHGRVHILFHSAVEVWFTYWLATDKKNFSRAKSSPPSHSFCHFCQAKAGPLTYWVHVRHFLYGNRTRYFIV